MNHFNSFFRDIHVIAIAAVFSFFLAAAAQASDHADTPLIGDPAVLRPDLNFTDIHSFTDGDKLVISLALDATVPVGFTGPYIYAEDASFNVYIDNHGPGTFQDIRLKIDFYTKRDGTQAHLITALGYGGRLLQLNPRNIQVFTGPRDDPFIRGPRQGRNVAAIVLKMPLRDVLERDSSEIKVWATVETGRIFQSEQHELAGQSMRSMLETANNTQHPSQHDGGPDVVVYDTELAAAFPNGRALTDDVVDLVPGSVPPFVGSDVRNSEGCGNVQAGTYTNCVTENENGFSPDFPYLMPPN